MKLAIHGGEPVVKRPWPKWPIASTSAQLYCREVLESERWSISGPRQAARTMAERASSEFAKFCGVEHAVGFDHGSSALYAALLALGIGDGDEVIVPALTWVACASAVLRVNATPVLVDCDRDTLCQCPLAVQDAINDRTRALLVVHTYGSMADLEALRIIAKKHDLRIIEDASHVHGSMWNDESAGTFGDIGIFSFQQGKQMSAGEGGMAVTKDQRLSGLLEELRSDGRRMVDGPIGVQHLEEVGTLQGFNLCPMELQSALMLDAIERFPSENAQRQKSIQHLDAFLATSKLWKSIAHYERNTHRTFYHYGICLRDQREIIYDSVLIHAALEAELQIKLSRPYPAISESKLFQPNALSLRKGKLNLMPHTKGYYRNAANAGETISLIHHSMLMNDDPKIIVQALQKIENSNLLLMKKSKFR